MCIPAVSDEIRWFLGVGDLVASTCGELRRLRPVIGTLTRSPRSLQAGVVSNQASALVLVAELVQSLSRSPMTITRASK